MKINEYFEELEKSVKNHYLIANEARAKGFDPSFEVEIPVANSLAERVLGLVSVLYPQILDPKIVNRILELEKIHGPLEPSIALIIAEEIAKEKFCGFRSQLEAIEAGIRVGLGYLTLGYVSSPIEGFIQLKLKKTLNNEEYFAVYYSGPIRSAGGSEAAFSLVIADHLREIFGYARYDPTNDEVKRGVHECYEYHERINNLQYLPSEEELEFLLSKVPVQITGDPSEDREVYNYKDLPRIETNFIRSGFTLVTGEGLAQKAPKILKRILKLKSKGFLLSGWEWLDDFVKLQKKIKEKGKSDASRGGATYIQDLVAGRPVFGHPHCSGAFRMRYGRCRNSGYSTLALHPATMGITNGFIAVGTQLKIEKPTKGCTIASCDSILGPIVLLNDGSVKKIYSYEEAIEIYPDVKEIIYLGDLLVPYGDFSSRNHVLEIAGYTFEQWREEIKLLGKEVEAKISFDEAFDLSKKYGVALHPDYTFFWNEIKKDQFLSLIDWLGHGKITDGKIILPFNVSEKERFFNGKRALEILGCEHYLSVEHIIIDKEQAKSFLLNLGIESLEEGCTEIGRKFKEFNGEKILELINILSSVKVKDLSGTFIGARMGRPEKAKLRKLTGSPHVLFPVGEEGGRLKSINSAIERGFVRSQFQSYVCPSCGNEGVYPRCEICLEKSVQKKFQSENRSGESKELLFEERNLDIRSLFDRAKKRLNMRIEELPAVVKGVKGTSNKEHSCEMLEKGLLRAKYNLHVNKDGTIRYDMTEMPITHFRANEIGTSISKLKDLGYAFDVEGKPLENDFQLLEIFPHDIILPSCPVTPDEKADDVFVNVSKFVDDELIKIYNVPAFFKAQKREDLIGHLLGCMSPHTSATAVGRLIGFSKVQALLASPYIHAAMRRDCLGYNSFVPIKKEGLWQIVKIGDFVEKVEPNVKVDIYGTLKKDLKDVRVWSNPGEKKIKEATKHTPTNMLRLVLEDGRKIELTDNHKVYTFGKLEKRASELKLGEKLMVGYRKDIEEKDISDINLFNLFEDRENIMIRNVRDYLKNFVSLTKHNNFSFRDSFPIKFVKEILVKNNKSFEDLPSEARLSVKRDNVSLPLKVTLSNELLEVIGLYISEGYLRKNESKKGFYQFSIAGNNEIRGFVRKVFLSHFGLLPSFENKDQIVFSSKIIYELFNDYLKIGRNAHEKRIPSLFLDLKKEKMASLLRGYYEGDGSVSLSDIRVSCDSVSEGLKHDLSFVLSRFGIYTKFYDYEKEPGPIVRDFYIKKNKPVPKFKITKITIPSNFVKKFKEIGFLSERKNAILDKILEGNPYGMKIDFDENYVYPKIVNIEKIDGQISYCFNVPDEHNFFANDLLVHNCDGDEAAVMLLMDLLLNFSRKFIPSHRGGTQDAPLVLNMRIRANEVDDMIFDLDIDDKIPLKLYEASIEHKMPGDVQMEQVKARLGGDREFTELKFTHNTSNINSGPLCSSYKTLPTMADKVDKMMELCKKIRAVDVKDVARLIIERHFIRDTRGNLRKFSMQVFRCSSCNSKYRRPPLTGKCLKCGGKLIFTISQGSVLKYMQPSMKLAQDYKVSPYLLESLELNQMYVESIFGRDKEKQEALGKWF